MEEHASEYQGIWPGKSLLVQPCITSCNQCLLSLVHEMIRVYLKVLLIQQEKEDKLAGRGRESKISKTRFHLYCIYMSPRTYRNPILSSVK